MASSDNVMSFPELILKLPKVTTVPVSVNFDLKDRGGTL